MGSGACRAGDPWAGTPPLPPEPTRSSWYRLEVHGHPAGFEQRVRGAGEHGGVWVRRRTWVLSLDGERTEVRAATRLEQDDDGYVRGVQDAAGRREGRALVLDLSAPPGPGVWPVWGDRGDPAPIEVTTDGPAFVWTAGGQPARAVFDPDGLVWAEHAGLRLQRVDGPVVIEPLDVVALLSVRVPTQPGADGALIGRYRIGDREVRVEAPVWAEVPPLPVVDVPPEGPPELRRRAADAIGSATDRREAVRRLSRAVSEALDGRATPGPPSALQALSSGRGDCDEHAEALVALARAAGLRARTVAGLVYTERPAPSFVPHAWAEVAFGERWIPVDPALRQVPADAARVPLGEDAADVAARVVAGLPLEVLELR